MQYVLAYAHTCRALTPEECRTYWERAWQALHAAATAQVEHHAPGKSPSDASARCCQRHSLLAWHTWRMSARGPTHHQPPSTGTGGGMSAASAQTPRWSDSPWVPVSANCMAIGSTLILKPRSAWYSGLADSQQAPLPITQQTLWKRMHEQGLLHRETGQQKNQVRRTIGGKREYVVSIPALYVQRNRSFRSNRSTRGAKSTKSTHTAGSISCMVPAKTGPQRGSKIGPRQPTAVSTHVNRF